MKSQRSPGQQLTGRFAVVEDLQRFGLQQAIALLHSEGCVGLFAHTQAQQEAFAAALLDAGIEAAAHCWHLYHARAADLQAQPRHLSDMPGLADTRLSVREDWGADTTQACRQMMQQYGVMPASEEVLRGKRVPSLLAIARSAAADAGDGSGQILGVGSLVWGHCPEGAWRGYAHLGMVCVDGRVRGQSLGQRLVAALLLQAVQKAGTAGITAACAPDNPASAKMLQACGLQCDSQRMCILFTRDGQRRTR